MSVARTAAAVALLAFVVVMATLPAAIASGLAAPAVRPLGALLGVLLALVCGVKVVAAAWGLAARMLERPRLGAVAASLD